MDKQFPTHNGDPLGQSWPGPVRVMVCVGYNPASQLLIRRAGQLARQCGATW